MLTKVTLVLTTIVLSLITLRTGMSRREQDRWLNLRLARALHRTARPNHGSLFRRG